MAWFPADWYNYFVMDSTADRKLLKLLTVIDEFNKQASPNRMSTIQDIEIVREFDTSSFYLIVSIFARESIQKLVRCQDIYL